MQLSILIPARSEEFLKNTVEDILAHVEAETEIIVVLDGEWAQPALEQHHRLNVIYVPEAIGQRAATNLACKLAQGKYVMKVDAHCAFDQGFDRKLIEDMQDDWTVVPIMRNLWVFDWKCFNCGWKTYQGPTPEKCNGCNKPKFKKKIIWEAKKRPESKSYSFDSEPHFQYFNEYTKREPYLTDIKTGLTESMSIQGSCFMTTREKYLELNLCDESVGSWGNQGIEVACKTWLSGGKVMINHKTWYAHMFRTSGDFVPHYLSDRGIHKTKSKVWQYFQGGWDKQIYPVSWLIKRFWPITPSGKNKGWTEETLKML